MRIPKFLQDLFSFDESVDAFANGASYACCYVIVYGKKAYVGSTGNIYNRLRAYKQALINGTSSRDKAVRALSAEAGGSSKLTFAVLKRLRTADEVADRTKLEAEFGDNLRRQGFEIVNALEPGQDLSDKDRPVIAIHRHTGERQEFASSHEAARILTCGRGPISNAALGNMVTYKDRVWLFAAQATPEAIAKKLAEAAKAEKKDWVREPKRIIATCLKTGVETHYDSTMQAERLGGFKQPSVSSCCKGKAKSHLGHAFRFA